MSSCALSRPLRPRSKRPERLAVQVNDNNRSVLQDLLKMLDDQLALTLTQPKRPHRQKHILLTRISRNLISSLLTHNPNELLLDPEDLPRRGALFFLDDACWAWMKKRAAANAVSEEQRRNKYRRRAMAAARNLSMYGL
jgi:hypothetical protein